MENKPKTGGAKVGDKILVVDAYLTHGDYKNGDILTVKTVYSGGVAVKENNRGLIDSEYTVLGNHIQIGDKLRLVDKPWEWDGWRKLPRCIRHIYISLKDKTLTVSGIHDGMLHLEGQKCVFVKEHFYAVPIALLCWVDSKLDDATRKSTNALADAVTNFGKALRKAPPAKHRYTPEQEQEARDIVYRMMMGDRGLFRFVRIQCETRCYRYLRSAPMCNSHYNLEEVYAARCSPNDEWSDDIGRLVALCKLLGEPLPEWIRGES